MAAVGLPFVGKDIVGPCVHMHAGYLHLSCKLKPLPLFSHSLRDRLMCEILDGDQGIAD